MYTTKPRVLIHRKGLPVILEGRVSVIEYSEDKPVYNVKSDVLGCEYKIKIDLVNKTIENLTENTKMGKFLGLKDRQNGIFIR